MKMNFLFTLLFCSGILCAQDDSKIVEEKPRFPGCEELTNKEERSVCSQNELLSYIYSNIRYPKEAVENGIEGIVVVSFIVEKDGSLSNISIVREIGGGCGEEAQRVIALMNEQNIRWMPGKQNNHIVRTEFNLPVTYRFETGKDRRKRRRESRGY